MARTAVINIWMNTFLCKGATCRIYKTTSMTNAATANIDINHVERVDGQYLSSQARCIRYSRQSTQLSDAAATPKMNIVDDAKRARVTAPITCSRAAVQSSAQ